MDRQLRNMCRKKRRHETFAAARAHADKLRRDFGDWVTPYYCNCGFFHVGHWRPGLVAYPQPKKPLAVEARHRMEMDLARRKGYGRFAKS